MADLSMSENGYSHNTSINDESFTINKRSDRTPGQNRANLTFVQSSNVSTRQEIFTKEITKVQDLMLEQEQSNEAELDMLTAQLAEIDKENAGLESLIAELESKESDKSEEEYQSINDQNQQMSALIENTNLRNGRLGAVLEGHKKSNARFHSVCNSQMNALTERKKKLAVERDSALKLVDAMEAEFNNVHKKYEKCKNTLELLKDAERKLAIAGQESGEKIRFVNLITQNLKEKATAKIDRCINETSNVIKVNKTEVAKLQAIVQRQNLKSESQDGIMLRYNSEIRETSHMCDKLIGKYSKHCGAYW